jgi:hypothetical protein
MVGCYTAGSALVAAEIPEFACDLTGVGALVCVPAGVASAAGAIGAYGLSVEGHVVSATTSTP